MNIQLMLKDISAISKKYDFIYQKTGMNFNIFDITNIGTDELKMCRIMHELINPHGSHCQGNLYLRLFLKDVLNMDFYETDYKTVKVSREYVISNDRRIDIFIETQDKAIPIEVKIYAGDQSKQCYDYYHQKARNSNLFYLTLSGNTPDPNSAIGLTPIYGYMKEIIGYKEVSQISFENEILTWLNHCLEQQDTIKTASIREILIQLIAVIRRLTNRMEEGKEMEISENLLSSVDNLKSAFEIEKSLPVVKSKIMLDFFEEINSKIISKGKEVLDYDKKSIADYYLSNVRTYPSLSIKIKELAPNLFAALCIEISDNLYYYYSFMEYDNSDYKYKIREISRVSTTHKKHYDLFVDAVKSVMKFEGKRTKSTFFWEYIFDDNGERYDFKHFSDSCIELLNCTKDSATRICDSLNKYIDEVVLKL